ncbi:hypothetical protein [Kamptonema formosum]|uniref:hypothetical protein n=1 Tax=Kamptonema formosum TaxID=331992 RepID=UPI0003727EAD|nr:hypothetical protein [Oscillatoria sp. PCC 10802]
MFQNAGMMPHKCGTQFWLAQIPAGQPATSPETAGLMFLSPQFFVALIAGVIMAFGFQFLLTNLSVAAKISDGDALELSDDDDSFGERVRQIGVRAGSWIFLTVNIAIFLACYLAVKLTFISSVTVGAIIGIVIWSAYFLLLFWMSSTAVGAFIGSLMKAATAGFKGVADTAATAVAGSAANQQIVSTVEASFAAVRRDLGSALDPTGFRETVEDYLKNLQPPKLDLKKIRKDFENLLSDADVKSLAGSDLLSGVNRQTFADLIRSRTDLSKSDINRLADQLQEAWQQAAGQQQQKDRNVGLIDLLQFAAPELRDRLPQLSENREEKSEGGGGVLQRVAQVGANAAAAAVLARTDISDLNAEKLSGQLQQLKEQATEQVKTIAGQVADKLPAQPQHTIKADVEDYLLNSKPWHLNRETLKSEFQEVIHDPEAAPGEIRRQIEQLNRDFFTGALNRRGDFTPERVAEIADQLESIRNEVFETVRTGESQEESQALRSLVEEYLGSTPKEQLTPENIDRDFKGLLEDADIDFETLQQRLSQFDRDTLAQMLSQRSDFSQEEAQQLIGQLESARDRVLSDARELGERMKSEAQSLRERVEAYLRDTNQEELNPDAIKRDFQTLFEDPKAGLKALRDRLSQFDRDTLVKLLSQREDLSEERVNQIIDRIEEVRDSIIKVPQTVADKAKEQYGSITGKIGDYLRQTNLEELDPEGIKRDFAELFQHPKEGAKALRERLAQIDRETLVALLSQREDLSEEKVNQIIDRVQEAIDSIVRAPRRLATRTQETVRDFQANLENYLRNTHKEELNPEGIKRDLQLLLKDPRAGVESLGDRLSQFDRSTLVALLSQRQDISEEEANQIADRIVSVRDQFAEQAHKVQEKIQSAADAISARIRDYLNSLERPELNYEGIKQDFRKLFEDPQAGFDAIKERLSQFDRGTLVAILSSREDISEEDANRIADQIESVRDSAIKRADRLQEAAKKRIKELKHKAKEQAENTREAAAVAAWWLFGTALTSAVAAALAGAIAVAGIPGIVG